MNDNTEQKKTENAKQIEPTTNIELPKVAEAPKTTETTKPSNQIAQPKKPKKKLTKKQLIIFIVVALLFVVGITFAILNTKKREKKEADDIKEQEEIITKLSTFYDDSDSIITLLKNYYYSNNLVQADNILYWQINDIYYIGKYKGNESEYFKITGTYKCRDNQNTCVSNSASTTPNEYNEYEFKIYAGINNNQIQKIQDKMQKENFVVKEEYIKNSSKLAVDVGSEVMNYYYGSGIAVSGQITAWTINAQYEKTIDGKLYYLVTSAYTCQSNDSSCFTLQQPLNKNSYEEYVFKVYAIGTAENDDFTLENIIEIM